jgi:Streptomycin adenylyltransferase
MHRSKVEAACRAASTDADVVGMAVAGSFAAGNADEFSDVDLRLYVSEVVVDTVVGRIPDLAAACGQVVALFSGEHVGSQALTIVLFDDLVHVDFEVLSTSRVAEHNQGRPAVILWERDGLSTELPGAYETDVAADLRWLEDRIWTWSWYIQTKVLRGELYEALDGLQYVRDQVLFRLLAFHRGVRPAGGRRAEALVGAYADAFGRTVSVALERGAVLDALRAETDLYLELAEPLLMRHGVDPSIGAREVVLRALEAGLNWSMPGLD